MSSNNRVNKLPLTFSECSLKIKVHRFPFTGTFTIVCYFLQKQWKFLHRQRFSAKVQTIVTRVLRCIENRTVHSHSVNRTEVSRGTGMVNSFAELTTRIRAFSRNFPRAKQDAKLFKISRKRFNFASMWRTF